MNFFSPSNDQRAILVANICLAPSESEYHIHCVSFQVFPFCFLDLLLLRSHFDGSVDVCLSFFACFSIGRHSASQLCSNHLHCFIFVPSSFSSSLTSRDCTVLLVCSIVVFCLFVPHSIFALSRTHTRHYDIDSRHCVQYH